MYPFDPDMEFEEVVLALNNWNPPGSLISGKTRNCLIDAWALYAGKKRATKELAAAISRHGSKTALARHLKMRRDTISALQGSFDSLTEQYSFPRTAEAFRRAFEALPGEKQLDMAIVTAELLQEPDLLLKLANSKNREITKLLQGALRITELRHAVDLLILLLQSKSDSEAAFQAWFDDHSWVFGGSHRMRDDVRQIHEDSIVDFLLPDVVGYRDVFELKRPDLKVLSYDKSHKTFYFTSDVSKSISQVHKYMDRLHEVARKGLHKFPHIVAYHPRATIIIGRSEGWSVEMTDSLRGLNQRLHGIDIMTYDHVIERAETILSNLRMSKIAGDRSDKPSD